MQHRCAYRGCGEVIPDIYSRVIVLEHGKYYCDERCREFERRHNREGPRKMPFLMKAAVVVAVTTLLAVLWASSAHKSFGAPPPDSSHIFSAWFLSQKQVNGVSPCCGDEEHVGGDGHYVNVRNLGQGYEVEIDGVWVLYPLPIDKSYHSNPTGRNVVWYTKGEGYINFYCLRLAEGT